MLKNFILLGTCIFGVAQKFRNAKSKHLKIAKFSGHN